MAKHACEPPILRSQILGLNTLDFAGEGFGCRHHVHLPHPSQQSHAAAEADVPSSRPYQSCVAFLCSLMQILCNSKLQYCFRAGLLSSLTMQLRYERQVSPYCHYTCQENCIASSSQQLFLEASERREDAFDIFPDCFCKCSLHVDALPH